MSVNVIDITAGGNTIIPFDTLFTATIKNFEKGLKKNFLDYRPIVAVMMDKYKHTDSSGGRLLQMSAAYGYNTTTRWFRGEETFDQTPAQTALPLIYEWYYLGSAVSVTRTQMAENRGKVALFNILESQIDQAMRTMTTDLGTALYGDGFNQTVPVGLAGIISTTPTVDLTPRPVGGLSVTNANWWQNVAYTSCGSFAANGVKGTSQDLVYQAFNTVSDGGKKQAKVVMTSQELAYYYNQTNLGVVRYVNIDSGQRGDLTFQGEQGGEGQLIRGLYYEGIPWIWDRQCPTGRMYMWDPADIYVMTDPSMFFEWTELLQWPNQLAYGKIVALRVASCAEARMFSVVLDGWSA